MERCQRCGEEGEDRRTLWMACFYEMAELGIPFEEARLHGTYHAKVGVGATDFAVFSFRKVEFATEPSGKPGNRTFYTLRVCKECRGDWLAAIRDWFCSAPTPENGDIPMRVLGATRMVSESEFYQQRHVSDDTDYPNEMNQKPPETPRADEVPEGFDMARSVQSMLAKLDEHERCAFNALIHQARGVRPEAQRPELRLRSLRDELAFLLDSTVDLPPDAYDRDTLLMRLEAAMLSREQSARSGSAASPTEPGSVEWLRDKLKVAADAVALIAIRNPYCPRGWALSSGCSPDCPWAPVHLWFAFGGSDDFAKIAWGEDAAPAPDRSAAPEGEK